MRALIDWWRAQFSPKGAGDRATQGTAGPQSPAIDAGGNVVITYNIQEAASFQRGERRVPRQLPDRPVGGHLFGRDAELQKLLARLKRGEHSAVVGPAGLGKTALAAEAIRIVVGEDDASLQASPFPDGVVLLDLYRLKGRADEAWNALANALMGSKHVTAPARQRAQWACRGRRVLIIIEGAEEADGRESRARLTDLRSVLDAENRCLILTRDGTQVLPAEAVRLTEALEPEAAGRLFDQITGRSITPAIREAVLELLQGHPLALTWAASLLTRGDEGPQQLLAEWKQTPLLGLSDPVEARHTLQWLFERSVRTLDPAERMILDAAGLLAHAEFPFSVMKAALGDETESPRAGLKRLVQLGLLRLSSQQEDYWHFTHVLGYQFARRESGAHPALREQLGLWLQRELREAMLHGHRNTLPKVLLHVTALLSADDDQGQWSLASFCLYDAVDRVWALGHLDLVVQLLNGVKRWMQNLSAQSADEAQWRRERGVLLERLGNLRQAQGDLAAALRSYTESLAIREQLAHSDPSNAHRQRDLSIGHNKMGDVQQAQGDLAAALRSYTESLTIHGKLVRSDPSNADRQRDLSVSHNRIGDVQKAQGDLAAALHSYTESLTIREKLALSNPTNIEWQRDLTVCYIKLGDVHREQGDLAAALRSYTDAKDITEKLTRLDPSITEWQRDLSISHNKMGYLQQVQGDLVAAQRSYTDGKDIAEKLARSDPTNAEWQRDWSYSLTKLSEVAESSGEREQALRYAEESLAIDERLSALDKSNITWQKDVRVSQAMVARLRGS